jgi:hypothetical protein
MKTERHYRQDIRLPSQEISGQSVIVVPAKSEMHLLDEVGTFLWIELRRSRSAKELVASVREEFEVGQEQSQRDVDAFLAMLLEKGLVIAE